MDIYSHECNVCKTASVDTHIQIRHCRKCDNDWCPRCEGQGTTDLSCPSCGSNDTEGKSGW